MKYDRTVRHLLLDHLTRLEMLLLLKNLLLLLLLLLLLFPSASPRPRRRSRGRRRGKDLRRLLLNGRHCAPRLLLQGLGLRLLVGLAVLLLLVAVPAAQVVVGGAAAKAACEGAVLDVGLDPVVLLVSLGCKPPVALLALNGLLVIGSVDSPNVDAETGTGGEGLAALVTRDVFWVFSSPKKKGEPSMKNFPVLRLPLLITTVEIILKARKSKADISICPMPCLCFIRFESPWKVR